MFFLIATAATVLPSIQREPGFVATVSVQEQPAHRESATMASSDIYYDKQWAIFKIMAPQAWEITSGDADVTIAVLDTGINRTHEDLVGKVIAEINLTDSTTVDDIYGHGTHIAGIIAATANNGLGVAGLAYNCRLINVKVADDSGVVWPSKVAKGIVWAVDNGADIINMSLFLPVPSRALEEAVNYAWSNGAIVIAAAGNYIGTSPTYPAYYSNCIAVAATDANDSIASWSGWGDWIDVAAPGVSIYSTLPKNDYGSKSGTSMATAYVSGVAGLLFTLVNDENGNGFVNDEVRLAIEHSCDETNIGGIGQGRINAFEAVAEISASK